MVSLWKKTEKDTEKKARQGAFIPDEASDNENEK